MSPNRKVPRTYLKFKEDHPEIAGHYEALGRSLSEMGALDRKTAALVKLALAVARQGEGGVHSAVRKGLDAGLTAAEMRQTALMAITTVGFSSAMAAYTWVNDVVGEE